MITTHIPREFLWFPVETDRPAGVSPNRNLKLFSREIIFGVFQSTCKRYLNVTDRQTDRRTDNFWEANVSAGTKRNLPAVPVLGTV